MIAVELWQWPQEPQPPAFALPRFTIAQGATIKIGNQADMTGFLSVYGYAFDIGAKAAVRYINEHGEIAGRKVEYFLEDTEF